MNPPKELSLEDICFTDKQQDSKYGHQLKIKERTGRKYSDATYLYYATDLLMVICDG